MIDLYHHPALAAEAGALARLHGFRLAGSADLRHLDCGHVLYLDDAGLSLRQTGKKAPGPITCEFVAGNANHRRLYGGGKSQLIAKAVGIKGGVRPAIADLTAGLGGDAFVFASLGCPVTLMERHPVVAALLADGLRRARADAEGEVADVVARMQFRQGDARQWLASMPSDDAPQVIYLDPMFPERRKSAAVNKSMTAFQHIVGTDPDADDLLPLALAKARNRVVVKRPARAPWLNHTEPGLVLEGKSVRFDIYPLRALTE